MEFLGYNITRRKEKSLADAILGANSGSGSNNSVSDSFTLFDESFLQTIGLDQKDAKKLNELMSKLRMDTVKRKDRYKEYKQACKDPIIGQAVEMMADDATQFDVERERTVWVESEDKKYADALNGIINDYIEPFIDTMAAGIISKGEFAFKINRDEEGEERGKFKDVVLIPYKNIEKLHHLILPNQDRYFYEVDDITNIKAEDDNLKNFKEFTDFLHFINYSIDNSEEVDLKVPKKGKVSITEESVPVFVLQGESIIAEKVLETYRILKTLEDAVTQYRLAKSKLIRFVNVDVTRLADDSKVQAVINYIHGALATSEAISGNAFESTTSQAAPVVVTVPVKNGVGTITVQEFNSDVNVRDIADLDYFLNKIFAGLRTPRSYFNFDEALPGVGVSGASLARIDIRYARAVKKVQRVIVNGIKDLIWVFNEINGIEQKDAPKVKVKIVKVASSEDYDRYTEYEQRLAMAGQVMTALIDPQTGMINMTMIDMYIKFFTYVVPSSEMIEFLNSLKKKTDIKSKPTGVGLTGIMQQPKQAEQTQKES